MIHEGNQDCQLAVTAETTLENCTMVCIGLAMMPFASALSIGWAALACLVQLHFVGSSSCTRLAQPKARPSLGGG